MHDLKLRDMLYCKAHLHQVIVSSPCQPLTTTCHAEASMTSTRSKSAMQGHHPPVSPANEAASASCSDCRWTQRASSGVAFARPGSSPEGPWGAVKGASQSTGSDGSGAACIKAAAALGSLGFDRHLYMQSADLAPTRAELAQGCGLEQMSNLGSGKSDAPGHRSCACWHLSAHVQLQAAQGQGPCLHWPRGGLHFEEVAVGIPCVAILCRLCTSLSSPISIFTGQG